MNMTTPIRGAFVPMFLLAFASALQAQSRADDVNLSYSYGPLHKDGYLYMALGSPFAGRSTDRGAVIRVPVAGGKHEVVATGLRNPNGIGLGPDREIYVTDTGAIGGRRLS